MAAGDLVAAGKEPQNALLPGAAAIPPIWLACAILVGPINAS